jgi:hypothetical protein
MGKHISWAGYREQPTNGLQELCVTLDDMVLSSKRPRGDLIPACFALGDKPISFGIAVE